MKLIDTHAHLHDPEFFTKEAAEQALESAINKGVSTVISIATSLEDSTRAIDFATQHSEHCWASIGVHPHEAAQLTVDQIDELVTQLQQFAQAERVVAVGECGLDFYYNYKTENLARQERLLRGQIEIALANNLPISFHVREAFVDFWRILSDYPDVKGVLHSFTDTQINLEKALERGFMIGINGIATFTNHQWQLDLFRTVPLENVVVETDSPFLTPTPRRGTINTPENVIYITEFLAELRGEVVESVAEITTANAKKLFNIE